MLTLPVLFLSPLVQKAVGITWCFPVDKYILFALASFVFWWVGRPFLTGMLSELRDKRPGMMTLISLAISVAYFYSSAVVFGLKGKFFLGELVTLINFGRATYRKMLQNLWWATGYNAIAIPLAAGVLLNYGILISPAIGAALMSLSTVIVAINARMLRLNSR